MGPEGFELVGEGVDAAVHLHEALVVEVPAAVELVTPSPVGALDASGEFGEFGGRTKRATSLASYSALNSLPPSTSIGFTLDGMSLRTLRRISRPVLPGLRRPSYLRRSLRNRAALGTPTAWAASLALRPRPLRRVACHRSSLSG